MSSYRVAIHIPSLAGGGAERAFVSIANGLAESGYSVDLVLEKFEGEFVDELSYRVKVVELVEQHKKGQLLGKSNASLGYWGQVRLFIKIVTGLVRYLEAKKPNVVIAALNGPIINTSLAKKMTRKHSFRLIASQRNNFSRQNSSKTILGLGRKARLRWALRQADKVVAPSRGVAEDLIDKAGVSRSKTLVIHNPVIDSNFVEKSKEDLADPWFESNIKKFIFVGRLSPVKRVQDIIYAFSKVVAEKPAVLTIVGQGTLRSELEKLVESLGLKTTVRFFGFDSNPYKLIRASDCLVLASEHEGFPNVLVQSLALGTQVISSDCEYGPEEILDGASYGRLFPVGDVDKLAAHMLEIMETNEETTHLVRRGKVFSWESIQNLWASLLV